MNGFMVALRHTMDDVPLRLFDNNPEALDFARGVGEDDDRFAREIISSDASTPVSVAVYEFRDGILANVEIVKSFDDEEVSA